MSRKLLNLFLVLALLVGVFSMASAQDEPVSIVWFIGLGTGSDPAQVPTEEAVVEAFNASHDDIQIELVIVPDFEVSRQTLSTLIATGEPPDIIGPVGFGGTNDYRGNWMDLEPLVEAAGYDLSQLKKEEMRLEEINQKLKLELATLKSPQNLERLAIQKLGLGSPKPEQIILLP